MRHPLFSMVLAISLGTATTPVRAQHHHGMRHFDHHGNSDAWKWAAGAVVGAAVIQSLNRPNVVTIQQPFYPTTVYPTTVYSTPIYPTTVYPTTVYSAPIYDRSQPVYTSPVYSPQVYTKPYNVYVDGVAYSRQNAVVNGQLQEVLVRR